MGFISDIEKKNVLGPSRGIYSLKVQNSPDQNLKWFVYVSIALTQIFLEGIFDRSSGYDFLNKYKGHLNPAVSNKIFKLYALEDLQSLIGFEEIRRVKGPKIPPVLLLQNPAQFERDVQFIFDCDQEDRVQYDELRRMSNELAEDSSIHLLQLTKKVFGDLTPTTAQHEKDLALILSMKRWEMFRGLIKQAKTRS